MSTAKPSKWPILKKGGIYGAAITVILALPNLSQAAQAGGIHSVAHELKQVGFDLVEDTIAGTISSTVIGAGVVGGAAGAGITVTTGGAAVTTIGGFSTVGGAVTVTAGLGYAAGYSIGSIPIGGGENIHDGIANLIIGSLDWVGLW